jgi:hypothetical protein
VAKRSEVAKSGVADPQQIPADAESWRRHTAGPRGPRSQKVLAQTPTGS